MHNWQPRLHITDIRANETFKSGVEEYYHYREAHNLENSRCRCTLPWMDLKYAAKTLLHGTLVHTSVNNGELRGQFSVVVGVGED
jgi:hypothetical protein